MFSSCRTGPATCGGRGPSDNEPSDMQRTGDARVSRHARQYRSARAREQSDCDDVWIRADERRLRQTEQMHVLAAHGLHITASSEWFAR